MHKIAGSRVLWSAAGLFLLLGLAIYSNVILKGEFLFDDFEYVVGNPLITDFSHTGMSDPRQIGYVSFAANYAVGGYDPRGYHLVNVLIHICNAVSVLYLIPLLMVAAGDDKEGGAARRNVVGAAAGLLFLVHPLATQAVSYVTQRFTCLATFFYLQAVLWYLAARLRLEMGGRRSAWVHYGIALASTLLAMKTKEIAFTIPFALVMFETLLFRGSALGRRRFLLTIPFLVAAAIIPLSILGPDLELMTHGQGIAEITRREKIYDLTQRSFTEYLLTQFRVVVIYLRLLVLPLNQQAVYDLKVSRSVTDPAVLGSLGLLVVLGWGGFLAWRWARKTRDESAVLFTLVAMGTAWFFLTLSVESSMIPIKDLIFEHRTYLPGVGFAAVAAAAISMGAGKMAPRRALWAAAGVALLVAVPLSVATYIRNDVWTTELKFWDDVVKKNPGKAIGYHNRGNAYAKEGKYDLALRDMDKTISLFPRSYQEGRGYEDADFTSANMAKTYMNRGTVYLDMGDLARANADFEMARRVMVAPLVDIPKILALADAYSKKGAYRHAIEEYNRILQWDPENVDALNDRANAYSYLKKYGEAIRDLSRIILVRPETPLAYHNRGIAYAWYGKRERAVADFRKACSLGFDPACQSVDIVAEGRKEGEKPQ